MNLSRIYIDSSTLIGNGWPEPGAALQKMLGMARFLGVTVFLPEIVEAECEAEWLRRFDTRAKQLTGALDALTAHVPSFARPRIALPSVDDARAYYRGRVEVAKELYAIATSTLTGRSLADLIYDAAHHAFPFAASDSSFRDAVILLSVSEHVDASPDPVLAFLVTEDQFFSGKGRVLASGSEIRPVVKELDSVDKALQQQYTAGIIAEWTLDREKLREAATNDGAALTAFLSASLSIPVGFSFFGLSSVKAVRGLTLKQILSVSPSLAVPSDREPDTIERISMRAQVTIHETVESSPARQSINTLRVGEETPPPEPYSYQPPQLNDIDVDFEVEIEADARIVDGEYVGLTYASAKMGERIAG